MESLVFNFFTATFKLIAVLMIAGTLIAVLTDLQQKAFGSKRHGLLSIRIINEQLAGPIGSK